MRLSIKTRSWLESETVVYFRIFHWSPDTLAESCSCCRMPFLLFQWIFYKRVKRQQFHCFLIHLVSLISVKCTSGMFDRCQFNGEINISTLYINVGLQCWNISVDNTILWRQQVLILNTLAVTYKFILGHQLGLGTGGKTTSSYLYSSHLAYHINMYQQPHYNQWECNLWRDVGCPPWK